MERIRNNGNTFRDFERCEDALLKIGRVRIKEKEKRGREGRREREK